MYPDKQILIGKLGNGDPVGVTHLLLDIPFRGELIPLKETVAYRGSRSDMVALKRSHSDWIIDCILRENQSQARLYQKIEDCISKSLAQRIAKELLDLADRLGRRSPQGTEILIDLTRRKISQMVGCASESVVRILSQWEKKGWIATRSKRITLCKPRELRGCAHEGEPPATQTPVSNI